MVDTGLELDDEAVVYRSQSCLVTSLFLNMEDTSFDISNIEWHVIF